MKRLILLVLAGLAAAMVAQADIIYVQGNVSGVWSADTVMVTREVRVPPGQTLVIEPGVKVLFQVYCKFIVDSAATLRAVGTEADSILFDFTADDVTHWHSIRFLNASDSCRLEYCTLRGGYASGISIEDREGGAIYCSGSSPAILHCRIEGCYASYLGGAVSFADSSHGIIANSELLANYAYSGGAISCWQSAPIIVGNTISDNSTANDGGAILLNYSSPMIISNSIMNNIVLESGGSGGGIYSDLQSSPFIGNNVIGNNSAYWGVGIAAHQSHGTIIHNIIIENHATWSGAAGGISCYDSDPEIAENLVIGNSAHWCGGIECNQSSPAIWGNMIVGNTAINTGGGIRCNSSSSQIRSNLILGNAGMSGGGIYSFQYSSLSVLENFFCQNIATSGGGGAIKLSESSTELYQNTMVANSAPAGGAIYQSGFYQSEIDNGIFWDNVPDQIYTQYGYLQVIYSDVQDTLWPGLGNINAYPTFVDTAHDDYRLLWGSPCIDTGDPNPIYNDPDGTRADMGAFYYDQSTPVRILLTPHEIPYLIPDSGGTMDYTIRAFNRDSLAHTARIWCDLTFPDSSIHGPVLGPVRVTLGAGALLERIRTQNIPASAPMGVYHYNAYAVVGADTSKDSFMWGKLGAGGLSVRTPSEELAASNWTNTGEPITDVGGTRSFASTNAMPTEYALHPCSPNPFNAVTVARFELRDASYVSLKVYNTAGRLVETLVNGWREAGAHEVTFDAGDLPSGMYFCRIQAGEFEATQKLVLLK